MWTVPCQWPSPSHHVSVEVPTPAAGTFATCCENNSTLFCGAVTCKDCRDNRRHFHRREASCFLPMRSYHEHKNVSAGAKTAANDCLKWWLLSAPVHCTYPVKCLAPSMFWQSSDGNHSRAVEISTSAGSTIYQKAGTNQEP